jgi:uncharacterized protein (TIGR02246 family)
MSRKHEASDEAAIKQLFDNWFAGTEANDIDRIVKGIADDIVSYEHDSPLEYRGIDSVRAVCQKGLDLSGGRAHWDIPQTTVLISGDLAVQWGLNRMRFVGDDGKASESWSRGTRVLAKREGAWQMIHQHVSYPYEPETGAARTDLTPTSNEKSKQPSAAPKMNIDARNTDEQQVRDTIERWVNAIQERDLANVTAHHTADVVMFDVPLPVAVRGIDAYRNTWPGFFEWQEKGRGKFEIVSLDVTAGNDVAFATAVLRCGSAEELKRDNTPKLRLTIGLRKEGAQWLIAHEHHSFPIEDT